LKTSNKKKETNASLDKPKDSKPVKKPLNAKGLMDDEDDDVFDDDEMPKRKSASSKKEATSKKKGKAIDDDDDELDDVDDIEDDWEKVEEDDQWDEDFEEFDLPKSKMKKPSGSPTSGARKSKKEADSDDDFKLDDEFKDIFGGASDFDDADDDDY